MTSRASARDRFVAGDPLRALAALGVVVFHVAYVAYLRAGSPGWYEVYGSLPGHLLALGSGGIYVFFVLSGYLLARPFIASVLDGTPSPRVGAYVRNRVLRIVPLFWAACALALLRHGTAGATHGQLLALVGFAQTYAPSVQDQWIGQGWTLDIEAAFYVALPLAGLLTAWTLRGWLGRAGRALALFAGLLALAVLSLGAFRLTGERSFPAMLFAFVPGMALALGEPFARPRVRGVRWAGPLAGGLFVAGVVVMVEWERRVGSPQDVRGILAALGSAGIVGAPLLHQWATGGCSRLLDNAPLRWVGERSYSLYLLHLLVLYDVAHALAPARGAVQIAALSALPGIVLSLALAALAYRMVERPFLALRHAQRRGSAHHESVPDGVLGHHAGLGEAQQVVRATGLGAGS